jgi:hypothetical protein
MADHSDFLDLAREMISEEGREVVFAKLDADPADATKPWRGAGAPTPVDPVTTFAVFLPDGSGLGKLTEDNELFKTSENVLLVAPPVTGEDLEGYHVVTDDGVRWKINVVQTVKPATLAVLYAMGVSR